MPRLIKLIDVQRFKKIMKSFSSEKTNDETILKQYYTLYMYSIVRLLAIALMITYFIATIFLYVSTEAAGAGTHGENVVVLEKLENVN